MREVNAEGIAKIKQWEALRLEAYRDEGGTWTIGYGHTATARPGMLITEQQAEALLAADLDVAEMAVSTRVLVPLSDRQFAALVSFVFNVGVGAFAKSTLLRKLNKGEYGAVPDQMTRWNKITKNGRKVVSNGLGNRRAAEAGLWASGAFVTSSSVPAATPAPAVTAPQAAAGATVIATVTALITSAGTALEPVARVASSLAAGVPWQVQVAAIVALGVVALAYLLRRPAQVAA